MLLSVSCQKVVKFKLVLINVLMLLLYMNFVLKSNIISHYDPFRSKEPVVVVL